MPICLKISVKSPMDLALYEPDIPQNTGAMIRLGACLGTPVHIIEPCGFPFSAKALRRAGMDYIEAADLHRHNSWDDFEVWRKKSGKRLLLLSTKASSHYTDFNFQNNDILMVGRESAGVPDEVAGAVDFSLTIKMKAGVRSLNVATAAAMVLGEALRQTGKL